MRYNNNGKKTDVVRVGLRWHLVAVSAYLLFPGLHVGPPVQEDLDGLQVAFLSSIVESGGPTLS